MKKYILLSAFLFVLINVKASDGVIIKSQTVSASGKTTNTTLQVTSTKLFIQNSGSDNSSLIYDDSNKTFTFIDNSKKEYYEFDKASLMELKDQLKLIVAMMKQFSSQMTPAQQKKLAPFLDPDSQPTLEYKKIGTGKFKNWNTTIFSGLSNNQEVINMNIAAFSSTNLQESDFKALTSLTEFMMDNLKEIVPFLPYNNSGAISGLDTNSPALKEGIPVQTTTYENGKFKSKNEVQSISNSNINETAFVVPKGYTKKSLNLQSQLSK
ncbi:MAG: hypothetical protein OCD76_15830 [Reichenbachiella sp.]